MQHHFCGIPTENAQSESNYEETLDKSKLRDSLPKTWPEPFKKVHVMKDKKHLRSYLTLKETKVT